MYGKNDSGDIMWDFDKVTDDIIKYAKKFEAYACGDDDLKEAMAEQAPNAKE
jgi:hypothetical protein